MTLKELIDQLGTNEVARKCGVTDVAVVYWKRNGLPRRNGKAQVRRAHYERVIAKMAGMRVAELRQMLAEEEARRDRQG